VAEKGEVTAAGAAAPASAEADKRVAEHEQAAHLASAAVGVLASVDKRAEHGWVAEPMPARALRQHRRGTLSQHRGNLRRDNLRRGNPHLELLNQINHALPIVLAPTSTPTLALPTAHGQVPMQMHAPRIAPALILTPTLVLPTALAPPIGRAQISTPTLAPRIALGLVRMLTPAWVIVIGEISATATGRPTATRPGQERTSTIE
jgi:hypothetical protein